MIRQDRLVAPNAAASLKVILMREVSHLSRFAVAEYRLPVSHFLFDSSFVDLRCDCRGIAVN